MKRNSKSVVSVIAAAVFALLAAGCVTVPSGEFEDPRDLQHAGRSWDGCVSSEKARSAASSALRLLNDPVDSSTSRPSWSFVLSAFSSGRR